MKNIEDLLSNWTGNKVLMTIYPHPDDETMGAAGILMAAKKYDFKTIAITLTDGAAGKVHINLKGKSLSEIRKEEFVRAIKILGVDEGVIGPYTDGKLKEEKIKWLPWVLNLLYKHKPGIVVTYDHSGNSGHPDHIVLSIVLKNIIQKMENKPILLWTSSEGIVKKRMIKKVVADYASGPNYYLDMGLNVVKKWKASKTHKSQRLGKSLPIPFWLALFLFGRREWYHKVDLKKDYPYKFVEFKI